MVAEQAGGTTTFIPRIGDVMVHPGAASGGEHVSMGTATRNSPKLPGLDA